MYKPTIEAHGMILIYGEVLTNHVLEYIIFYEGPQPKFDI